MENIYETEEYRGMTIKIFYDESCESPRTNDCGNLSHMICFARHYSIGDEHKWNEPIEFLRDLVHQHVSYKAVKSFILAHKGDCWLEKLENRYILHDGESDWYDAEYDLDADFDAIAEQAEDYLSQADCCSLLGECEELVISTISMLDHSGVSVWIGNPSDPWDSGIIGFIYQTKKDTIEQNGATEENWKEVAWENMEAEMSIYANYLEGECYGFVVEDKDGGQVDSCWGYIGDSGIKKIKDECKSTIDHEVERREKEYAELLASIRANIDKINENAMFVNYCVVYRIDCQNLFKTKQIQSAPIHSGVVGVFSPVSIESVPVDVLKKMRNSIRPVLVA